MAALAGTLVFGGLAACSGGDDPAGASTIRVGRDVTTIQAAVARAKPGDIVLVEPGVYREAVEVTTGRITIRGLDRNTVIVDGELRRANGIVLRAAGGAVQNLTVRNATLNGILVTGGTGADYTGFDPTKTPPLQGFLIDHVTSHNNGLYGIYAFNAQHGVIENSYASGMADAGIYVGRCKPCSIAVRGNVAERNAVGFESTNASGPLFVYANRFAGNRVGATTNSHRQEAFVPQEGAHIIGNLVAANNEELTPAQAEGGFGIGIGIGGGTRNTVSKNAVVGNAIAGLVIGSSGDLAPLDNQIVANIFTANGVDVVYAATATSPGRGNCLDGNRLTGVLPAWIPMSCPVTDGPTVGVPVPAESVPKGIAFADVQAPPALQNLQDAATLQPPATSGLPGDVDLAAIAVPPADLLQSQSSIRW